MKHNIKTAVCLITIAGILLSSTLVLAATDLSIFSIIGFQNTQQAILDYAVLPDTENNRTTTDAYYDLYLNPSLRISSVDTYLNGYLRCAFNFAFSSIPAGFNVSVVQIDFQNMYNEDYFFTKIDSTQNTSLLMYGFFDNYWCWGSSASTLPMPTIHVRISIYSANGNTPPNYIGITPTASVSSGSYYLTALPNDTSGFANIIKNAITEALSNSELDLVYDLLHLWKTTQDGYLADIELSVDDIETWLSYINSVQVSQDNKLELIRQLLSTFPNYSSQMLNYMQQILSMNASQAAQAASNAAAQATQAQQASQAMAAANDFAKPDIGAMNIDPMDYVSADGFSGVSYILGSILNIPTILSMLLICVTCAFIGYALYGKKG